MSQDWKSLLIPFRWDTVALSSLVCFAGVTVAYKLSEPAFKKYNISLRNRYDWASRYISVVHALCTGIASVYSLMYERHTMPTYSGIYPTMAKVAPWSVGYFIYDFLMMVVLDAFVLKPHNQRMKKKDPNFKADPPLGDGAMLAHHIIGTTGLLLGSMGYAASFHLAALLSTEWTSPFINVLWFFDRMNYSGLLFQLSAVGLVVNWVGFRVLLNQYMNYRIVVDFHELNASMETYQMLIVVIGTFALSLMNLHWFSLIVKKIVRAVSKKSNKKEVRVNSETPASSPAHQLADDKTKKAA